MNAPDGVSGAVGALRHQRLESARSLMTRMSLDVLVVASTDSIQHRGNVRYLTNYSTRYGASLALLPLDGEPVLLVASGSFELGWARSTAWVDDVRPVGDFIAATTDLLGQITGRGALIGLAGLEGLPGSVGAQVISALPARRFAAVSESFRLMRSAKSGQEQAMARESVRIADSVLHDFTSVVEAGTTDRELLARASQRVQSEGSEDCFFLLSSGLDHVVMPMSTGRALEEPDIVRFSVEPSAPGGMWTQTIRVLATGTPQPDVRATYDLCAGALDRAAKSMRPGATGGDVAKSAIEVLEQADGGTIGPLGHGMGLDLVEPPYLRPGDETMLRPGAVVAVHPHLTWRGVSIWMGDTFLVTDRGAERLSQLSSDLIVV
jgi:Xaa-Pro dipeptidase